MPPRLCQLSQSKNGMEWVREYRNCYWKITFQNLKKLFMICYMYYNLTLYFSIYWIWVKQAQRRAAGDRSGRKYSEKYVFMNKNMTFGPLGHVLTLLKGPFHLSSHWTYLPKNRYLWWRVWLLARYSCLPYTDNTDYNTVIMPARVANFRQYGSQHVKGHACRTQRRNKKSGTIIRTAKSAGRHRGRKVVFVSHPILLPCWSADCWKTEVMPAWQLFFYHFPTPMTSLMTSSILIKKKQTIFHKFCWFRMEMKA